MSRPTVKAHIEAMSIAHAVFLLPPFHGGGRREITHRPKCFGFDTGFITFINGWDRIREDDRGLLWKHLVLDTLRAYIDDTALYYWRDKSGREIDFIIKATGQRVHAIECKIHPDQFDPKSLDVFRAQYPEGENYVIIPFIKKPFKKSYGNLKIKYCSTKELIKLV